MHGSQSLAISHTTYNMKIDLKNYNFCNFHGFNIKWHGNLFIMIKFAHVKNTGVDNNCDKGKLHNCVNPWKLMNPTQYML